MKRTMTYPIMLILVALGLFSFIAGNESGKVHLRVTKTEGGKTTVLQKTYDNMEALKSDEELKKFDILLDEWVNEAGDKKVFFYNNADSANKVMILKNPGNQSMTWVSEDGDSVRVEKEIIIKHRDGTEEKIVKENKEIMIITGEGKEDVTINIDDNGESKTWTDEKGNVIKLKESGGEKQVIVFDSVGTKKIIIKKGPGAEDMTWTDDKGNVMKLHENPEDKKVMVIVGDKDNFKEIQVDVETTEDENGNQKTITKKVWVTEDGKKMEMAGEDLEIVAKGDTFNIKLDQQDDEPLAMGNKVIMLKKRDMDEPGETIDVEIENRNGEQFIEINIHREAVVSVAISEIEKNDASLKGTPVSLKSNLTPSTISYEPNPGAGKFTLKFTLSEMMPVTVKVLDIQGNEMYTETVLDFQGNYDNQINLKEKSKGVYLLQISQNKKTLTRKIVIE